MKKILTLSALLLLTSLTCFAQNIENPQVENSDDWRSIITKIETDKQFTIVSFEYTATTDNSWAQLNKEIYIQTDQGNEHYNYVKSENISMAPAKHTLAKAGDKFAFKVYFKKIPPAAKSIDIIERAGRRNDGITFFNFYNVSLTQSYPPGTKVKVTDVVLLPPPPVNADTASRGLFYGAGNEMQNAMSSMGPMYASMAKSMLDAQLSYFKQPGKIAEMAKLNKNYFDALVKEGFTNDQALKIITSNSLISKSSSINGQ
ncbi:MAG TPA: hypothetical protein VK609_12525 [Mucilaginibacter sp.]|nr:hypothetical protein [Mucilaginibacter sp.]